MDLLEYKHLACSGKVPIGRGAFSKLILGDTTMIRILVVGGYTLTRENLVAVLRTQHDIDVREASAVEESRPFLYDASLDVIVFQHSADGNPLAVFLEAVGQCGQAGKVLVISSWISDLQKQALIRAGVGGIFGEHRHFRELTSAIRRIAAGKRWFEDGLTPPPRRLANGSTALSAQEQRAANLAIDCLSNKEIAARMQVSESYVKGLIQRVFLKVGVRSRSELIRRAMETAKPHRASASTTHAE